METAGKTSILKAQTKKDGWRPVLILPKRFPEKNSVHTPYRVQKTHTP